MRVPLLLFVSLVAPNVSLASLLDVARDRCAAKLETAPSLLETVVENTTTLPVTKVTFTAFKFLQPLAIGSCQVSLLPDGTEASAEELVEAEIAEHWRKYGTLRIWQDKVVRSLQPRSLVVGLLILKRPANTPDFRNAPNPSAQKAEFLSTFSASTLNRLMTAFPAGQFAPLSDMFAIRFTMTAVDVLAVARWADFEALEFDDLEGVLLQAATPIWFGASRFSAAHAMADGTGGRVGVIESGNVQTNQFVPNLVVRQPGSDALDAFHTESVVSVISNVFPGVQPGGAPGAQIDFAGNSRLAGNNFDSTRRALALLVMRSQDAYNLSFFEGVRSGALVLPTREPRAIGRLTDEAAYDLGLTVVAGAGNIPNPPSAIDFESFLPQPTRSTYWRLACSVTPRLWVGLTTRLLRDRLGATQSVFSVAVPSQTLLHHPIPRLFGTV